MSIPFTITVFGFGTSNVIPAGASNITVGVLLIVIGVTLGIINIISGASLLRNRRNILF